MGPLCIPKSALQVHYCLAAFLGRPPGPLRRRRDTCLYQVGGQGPHPPAPGNDGDPVHQVEETLWGSVRESG